MRTDIRFRDIAIRKVVNLKIISDKNTEITYF